MVADELPEAAAGAFAVMRPLACIVIRWVGFLLPGHGDLFSNGRSCLAAYIHNQLSRPQRL